MTEHLEVKILPTGKAVARRIDGLPLTLADRAVARRLAEDLRAQRGITVADVMRIFPGARIVELPIEEPKPSFCVHCDKDSVPAWRRGGKIIQVAPADGSRHWACHFCGRRLSKIKNNNPGEPKRKLA